MDETLVAGIVGAAAGVAGAGVVAWAATKNTTKQIEGATGDVERQLRQAREDLDRQLAHDRELRDLADLRAALQPLVIRVKTEGRFYLELLLRERESGSEMWRSLASDLAVEVAQYRQGLVMESSALLVTLGPGSPVLAAVAALEKRAAAFADGLDNWAAGRTDTDSVVQLLAEYDEADGDFVVAANEEIGRQRADKPKTGTKTGTSER
jgi:hypothetical protein